MTKRLTKWCISFCMCVLAMGPTHSMADSWTSPVATGVEAIHMASLHTGRVFVFSFRDQGDGATQFPWATFNPNNLGTANVVNAPKNYFCAGHTVLENGDFIMTDGQADATISRFNTVTEQMTNLGSLASGSGRWYPSTIILGNGKLFTLGGITNNGDGGNNLTGELYDPDTNVRTMISGGNLMPGQDVDAYPRLFLLSEQNGNIFKVYEAGPNNGSLIYTINTDTNSASRTSVPNDPGGGRLQATYCRLFDGRVMAMGGFPIGQEDGSNPTVTAVNPEAANPTWSTLASMQDSSERSYFLATLLPNEQVVVYGPDTSVETYNPATNSWSASASGSLNRGYHTGGVLLPDGRVCVSGGANGGAGGFGETNQVQIYSPNYMTANRPSITSSPSSAGYGSNISVGYSSTGGAITQVHIHRPGSSTHSFTYNMKAVPCSFTDQGSSLSVTLPSNPNLAPPGYYYLVISRGGASNRIPSAGAWIQLSGSGPPPDSNPPSQPSISTINVDSDTQLTAVSTVSTDAEGSNPVEYQFDETSGNSGGTDSGWQSGVNYIDGGLSASTQYCYRVRARDSQGNQTGYSSTQCQNTAAGPDTNPPTPNPMTFSSNPAAQTDAVIAMTATVASDAEGSIPIEYQFDETSGNPGGSDRGWASGNIYYDYGLNANTQYTYRVRARDSLGNTGSWSASQSATTQAEDGFVDITVGPGNQFTPANVTINVGDTIQWEFLEDGHNVWSGLSGAHTELLGQPDWPAGTMIFNSTATPETTNPNGFNFTVTFDQAFLDNSTGDAGASNQYNYHCHIHGSGSPEFMTGVITINGGTDTAAPIPNPMTFASAPSATSSSSIAMTATTALDGQSSPVQYFFDETSGNAGGSDSAWQASTSYTDSGLSPLTSYSYTVSARDAVGNTTAASAAGNATTPDVPSSNILLETGVVSGVGSSWTTVNLGSSYNSMVVVATPNYTNTSAPAHVRIQNASGNSFQIRVDGSAATPATQDVYYMVVEEGTYTVATDGVKMEAVKYSSSVTSNNNSWIGEARSYANSYTTPVVLGQVMTYNDAGHVTFWSRGSSRQNPPSSTALQVGKTVNEDPDNAHGNETIGYIVIDSGTGSIDGVNYSAGVTSDGVAGVTNSPPYGRAVSGLSGAASVGIATLTAMDGGNGGWAMFYGANPVSNTNINLAIDEDQLNDTERNHTGEQVAFIVFEDSAGGGDTTAPTPNPATFASAPAATSSSAIAMTATTASDPSGPVEYNFDNTSGGAGGTDSGWQASTGYTDNGLSASTQYCYTVQSRDSVGNTGAVSSAACATTQAGADTTPPTPNPATFASAPAAISSTAISMTATTGSDPSGPVEYFFTETTGNPGGSNSVWQTSTSYTDTVLTPSTQYCYTITSRDSLGNTGSSSSASCATTNGLPDTNPPSSPSISSATANSSSQITVTSTTSTDAEGSNPVEYQFNETTGGSGATDSGWQTSTTHVDSGLSASTQYCYQVRSRDSVGNTNTYSTASCATTDAAGGSCGSGQPYSNFVGAGQAQDVVVTTSSNDGSANGTNTVNGSGLSGNTHNTTWEATWTTDGDNGNPNAPNPSSLRGSSNWISYDLGHLYKLGTLHVWNANEIPGRGLNSVHIDYSQDGTNWTNLTSTTFAIASGSGSYTGAVEADFAGICARYVVITVVSNHGDGFANGLSEVQFNIVP